MISDEIVQLGYEIVKKFEDVEELLIQKCYKNRET